MSLKVKCAWLVCIALLLVGGWQEIREPKESVKPIGVIEVEEPKPRLTLDYFLDLTDEEYVITRPADAEIVKENFKLTQGQIIRLEMVYKLTAAHLAQVYERLEMLEQKADGFQVLLSTDRGELAVIQVENTPIQKD